jgi:hypothetical protein
VNTCPFRKSYPRVPVLEVGQDWDTDNGAGVLYDSMPSVIDLYTWTTPNGRKASITLEEFSYDTAWKIGALIGFAAGVVQILAGGPTRRHDRVVVPAVATT